MAPLQEHGRFDSLPHPLKTLNPPVIAQTLSPKGKQVKKPNPTYKHCPNGLVPKPIRKIKEKDIGVLSYPQM
jgi:hypothetical protein